MYPRCSSPSLTGSERGWEYSRPHLPFPSHTRARRHRVGRAHGVYLGSANGTDVSHAHTNTHRYTHPEQRRSRLTPSAFGPQISVRCGSQEPEEAQDTGSSCDEEECRSPPLAQQAVGTRSPLPPRVPEPHFHPCSPSPSSIEGSSQLTSRGSTGAPGPLVAPLSACWVWPIRIHVLVRICIWLGPGRSETESREEAGRESASEDNRGQQ